MGDWDWDIPTTVYKIITNESTRNSTQYPVMACMGKESKKEKSGCGY